MEDSFFGQKETRAERVVMATALRAAFWSFCDGQLGFQVSRTLLLIFLEILFFQHFTIFSCKKYDIITDLICIIVKR